MPTYEYRCPNGHTFEKFYPRMNDRRRLRCPTCGATAERVISGGAALVFKGSGFYITDYKRAGEKQEKPEKPEKQEKKEGESKTPESTPAESKPSESSKKKPAGDK